MSSGGSSVLAACNSFAPRELGGTPGGACPRPEGTMTPVRESDFFFCNGAAKIFSSNL